MAPIEMNAGNPISRHSSRRRQLQGQELSSFLIERLDGALRYDRISGYFCSSLLDVAGEALKSCQGPIRLVCNAHLSLEDAAILSHANEQLRREWCCFKPERFAEGNEGKARFALLYELLTTKKLIIRIVPDEIFGMVHGKAGIITMRDGATSAFLGSANDSVSGWCHHYELLWEDSSQEAIEWVEEEFSALWNAAEAHPLPEFIVRDIDRLAGRRLYNDLKEWRDNPQAEPAAPAVEGPLFRKELGLWEHQKYFVEEVFKAHRSGRGARLLLADQVGLGKTVQLAMSAKLMALLGDKPILILVPKPLVGQWQRELQSLLEIESASWNGSVWCDVEGNEFRGRGADDIRRCPRRFGVVSTGLITRRSPTVEPLKELEYECVILDEAHRARRERKLSSAKLEQKKDNNLYKFMTALSKKTKSLLLATATPVQLHPVEALDLLLILNEGGHNHVVGNRGSLWRSPVHALPMATDEREVPSSFSEKWSYLTNPLPRAEEDRLFDSLRRELLLNDDSACARSSDSEEISIALQDEIETDFDHLISRHNPFIRRIILRTRSYLEEKINPETKQPYLPKVEVCLHGEGSEGALRLPPHLQEAYSEAEKFCQAIAKRGNAGLLKTLVLRRFGSTLHAAQLTVEKLHNKFVLEQGALSQNAEEEDEEEEWEEESEALHSSFITLTEPEKELLSTLHRRLKLTRSEDPKYLKIVELLEQGWLQKGCIIFSQYYDSVAWLAEKLVEHFPEEPIGIYAGAGRSCLFERRIRKRADREKLKEMVTKGELRLLLGTDAASEGLNLQKLSALINLDLPWNPSRLEQRKGRIQRIGQEKPSVDIFNMRYADTVEDRVHKKLSTRLEQINQLFGQIPDTLEDLWIDIALGNEAKADEKLTRTTQPHPFCLKYHQEVRASDWERCRAVLSKETIAQQLLKGW